MRDANKDMVKKKSAPTLLGVLSNFSSHKNKDLTILKLKYINLVCFEGKLRGLIYKLLCASVNNLLVTEQLKTIKKKAIKNCVGGSTAKIFIGEYDINHAKKPLRISI